MVSETTPIGSVFCLDRYLTFGVLAAARGDVFSLVCLRTEKSNFSRALTIRFRVGSGEANLAHKFVGLWGVMSRTWKKLAEG